VVAKHLPAPQATRFATPVAQHFLGELVTAMTSNDLYRSLSDFKMVAQYLDPDRATMVAQQLVELAIKAPHLEARNTYLLALAEVGARMDANSAGLALPRLIELAKNGEVFTQPALAAAIGVVGPRAKSDQAAVAARQLVDLLAGNAQVAKADSLAIALEAVAPHLDADSCPAAAWVVVDAACRSPATFPSEPLARLCKTLARRLTMAELVNTLKQPACVGISQRILLEELGTRCQRRFQDLWEFADYARTQEPGLDLKTPAKRPALPLAS
jgi:hypothetical protein